MVETSRPVFVLVFQDSFERFRASSALAAGAKGNWQAQLPVFFSAVAVGVGLQTLFAAASQHSYARVVAIALLSIGVVGYFRSCAWLAKRKLRSIYGMMPAPNSNVTVDIHDSGITRTDPSVRMIYSWTAVSAVRRDKGYLYFMHSPVSATTVPLSAFSGEEHIGAVERFASARIGGGLGSQRAAEPGAGD